MSIFDNILKYAGLTRSKALGESTGIFGGMMLWGDNNKRCSAEKAMELVQGWSFACIKAIAEEIASSQLRVYKMGKDGKREELQDHPLLDLLNAVNDTMTGYELRYLAGFNLETVGNSYWLLDGVKNSSDEPVAIYLLDPRKIKVIRDSKKNTIAGYIYTGDPAETVTYQTYQILHLKYPNPADLIEGIGTVQQILQWIEEELYQSRFNKKFFQNGAIIGGFLESEKARTTEQLEYLRRSFDAIYKGEENAYKTAVLPSGVSYKEGRAQQKDMDFNEGQRNTRDKILAGFRVPKTVLGITDDVNRANAEATNYVFALRTIKPKLQLIETYLNEFLVPRYGDDLYVEFDDPVPENQELKIQEMTAVSGNQPVLSPNEQRQRYFGAPGVTGGDALRGTIANVPIGTPEDQKGVVAPRTRGKRPTTRGAKNKKARESMKSMISKGLLEAFNNNKSAAVKIQEKSLELRKENKPVTFNEEQAELILKARLLRTEPFVAQQKALMQKINGQWSDEVIKNIEDKTKAININDVYDEDKWAKIIVDGILPIQWGLFAAEGREAGLLIGLEGLDILSKETKKALEKAAALLAGNYSKYTSDLLKEKLAEGLRDNLPIADLKELVREVEGYSNDVRAESVARTETTRVSTDAKAQAWKQSGTVTYKKWYTAIDERVCPYCMPLHGKIVGIDEPFFKKGDSTEGEDFTGQEKPEMKLTYSDVNTPPLHVNCRCDILPEYSNE